MNGRLQERQDEMARFCRDTIEIMGEIISEHYDPMTLIQVSGALYDEGLDPPDLPPPNPMMGHNGGPPMQSNPGAQQPGMMPQPGVPPSPPAGPQQPNSAIVMPQESPEQKQQRKLMMIMQAIDLLRNEKLRGFQD